MTNRWARSHPHGSQISKPFASISLPTIRHPVAAPPSWVCEVHNPETFGRMPNFLTFKEEWKLAERGWFG